MTYHSTASPPGTALVDGGGGAADYTSNYSNGDVSYRNETWGHGSSFSMDTLRAIKTPPATAPDLNEDVTTAAAAAAAAAGSGGDDCSGPGEPLSPGETYPRWMRSQPTRHLNDLLHGFFGMPKGYRTRSSGRIEGSSDRKANRLDFKLPASFIPETSWLLETLPIPTQASVPVRPAAKSSRSKKGRPKTSTSASWSADATRESTTSIVSGRDTKFTKRGELYHESTRRLRGGESIQFARPLWPSRSPSSRQETVLLLRWFRENQANLQLSPSATRALLDPAMQAGAGAARRGQDAGTSDIRDGQTEGSFNRIAFHRDENGNVVHEEAEGEGSGVAEVLEPKRAEYHSALEKTCSLRELYAITFHELSRQVSAHCSERGTFMNELWVNYTTCLDEQLDILKRQRNAAMDREAALLRRVEAFDAERSSYKESILADVHRKDTEISIIRTQLEDERRAREKLEKERKKRRSSSTEDVVVERVSDYGGFMSFEGIGATASANVRRGSLESVSGPEERRRRRSSLYELPQMSSVHNHEIETLTSELESAGLRASEYRDELERVQTDYERMEMAILQLESQLAAAENRAELAESDLGLLQAECERFRDDAKRLTPRPERFLHEDLGVLSAEKQAHVRAVVEVTARSRDGVVIAANILLGGVAEEYNLDDETFSAIWAIVVKDKKQTTRRSRRSVSLVQVKDLLEQTHDNEDELVGRYGEHLAATIHGVISDGTAKSDDVVACMMGLVPGLGDAGAMLPRDCFGCLRGAFTEEQLVVYLEASMQSTRERMERDASTLTRLGEELTKLQAWKEQVDREKAETAAKRTRLEELKGKQAESSPMDIFLETEWQDTFIGLGNGTNVPRYMRTNSKIRNRNMTKRETEKTVKEIWSEKNALDKENSVSDLATFMLTYFQKKVGLPAAVTEMTYNFIFSLKKYDYDADCELFLRILLGQIKEEVYHEQIRLCGYVEDVFKQIDLACNGDTEARGVLQKEDAKQAMRSFFVDKTPERLEEVINALDEACPGNSVDYTMLFAEDREFNQGPFAECIRDQFLEERLEQFENLEKAIYECADYEFSCTAEHVETASERIFGKALGKQEIATAMQGREHAKITSVMEILRRGVLVKVGADDAKSGPSLRKAVHAVRATGKLKSRNKVGLAARRVSVAVDSVRHEWMKKESLGKQPLTTNRKMTNYTRPEVPVSPSKPPSVVSGAPRAGDCDDVAEQVCVPRGEAEEDRGGNLASDEGHAEERKLIDGDGDGDGDEREEAGDEAGNVTRVATSLPVHLEDECEDIHSDEDDDSDGEHEDSDAADKDARDDVAASEAANEAGGLSGAEQPREDADANVDDGATLPAEKEEDVGMLPPESLPVSVSDAESAPPPESSSGAKHDEAAGPVETAEDATPPGSGATAVVADADENGEGAM